MPPDRPAPSPYANPFAARDASRIPDDQLITRANLRAAMIESVATMLAFAGAAALIWAVIFQIVNIAFRGL